MAVSDFALATLVQVKTWLNIASTNATRDTFIEGLIEDVSVDIETETKREFVGRIYNEFYDGDGSDSLLVDHRPLNAVVTLIDDTQRAWDDTIEVIKRSDYMIDKGRGRIQLWNNESTFNLPDGGQNIKIEYHGNFSLLKVNLNRNDRIDFDHGGSEFSAQIPRGEYDAYTLAELIRTEMNSIAGATYHQCVFSGKTNKVTISVATSNLATLNLNFASGAQSANSMATLLGWLKTDLSGATTYTPATASNPHIPGDIKRACIRIVAQQYNQSNYGDGRQGIKRETIGDYSYTFEDILASDKRLQKTLDSYTHTSRLIG